MSNQEFESRLKHMLKLQRKMDWMLAIQCACVFASISSMVFLILLMGA